MIKKTQSQNPKLLCYFLTLLPYFAIASDTITAEQPLSGNQTLVSADGTFELGFFDPGNSKWYVGLWYKNLPPRVYVWVANRNNPLNDSSSGIMKIDQGNIVLVNVSSVTTTLWSSNSSNTSNSDNLYAQLLNSGNLVLRQDNDTIWQSFDCPTDTLLPDMILGWDSGTGLNRNLTSWKSPTDPSSSDFSFKVETTGFPEFFLRNKQVVIFRTGPWDGIRFSGVPEMNTNYGIIFSFISNKSEAEYSFKLLNSSLYSRLVVNLSGELERYTWIDENHSWNKFWYFPKDQCDEYKQCGVYGICDMNASPVCKCNSGFKPKNQQAWNLRDGSDGCVRKNDLNCSTDGFGLLKNMKLPQSTTAFVDINLTLAQCRERCIRNCSCTGYSNSNIVAGGSGCVNWSGDLVDMRQYAVSEGGQDFYLRLAAADLDGGSGGSSNKNKTVIIVITVTITVGMLILLSGLAIFFRKKRRRQQNNIEIVTRQAGQQDRSQDLLMNNVIIRSKRDQSAESVRDHELDLTVLEYESILLATNNFSDANKLGQGGFGSVYKGMLEGEDIAVKRLSKSSGQGIDEFKNELRLIARLQHRNLVRLLGCCVKGEEKMIIYEYMANTSLDSILFNKERSFLLNWQARFKIISGIARGLLYLHQDSRLRIIHRDLKASNVLLDEEMNPKISDFGMARIFGGDQTEADTRRIVGTYGYMAPEYAMDGRFSVKSDVFSFGVLVMEIICGIRNRGFYNTNSKLNLLGNAWKVWREGKGLELIDPAVRDDYSAAEVLRCIQLGLLCVQEQAEDRPTMSNVVLMLSSETVIMHQPKNPGFGVARKPFGSDSFSSKQGEESGTVNQVTVTKLEAR